MTARAELSECLHMLIVRNLADAIDDLARSLAPGSLDERERQLLLDLAESKTIRVALAAELARVWVKPRDMPERVQSAIADAARVEINRVQHVSISARPDGSTWISAFVSAPRGAER